MTAQTCITCTHHKAVIIAWETDEETGEEEPVMEHHCDGKRITHIAARTFRCGRYEEKVMQ